MVNEQNKNVKINKKNYKLEAVVGLMRPLVTTVVVISLLIFFRFHFRRQEFLFDRIATFTS